MDFKKEIEQRLQKILSENVALEEPKDDSFGDFSLPCFLLAKKQKKSPVDIAKALAEQWKYTDITAEPLNAHLNFHISSDLLAQEALEAPIHQSWKLSQGKTILIDFSAPNIAKPFHIGHLRSTVIGNALYKMNTFVGNTTIGINHIGDWGTPFGKYMVAYQKWGKKEELEKNPIQHLLWLYVTFNKEADEAMENEARAWFKKLEEGNEEAVALWKLFREYSLKEFNRIYEKLHISFDHIQGESFYEDKMEPVLETLREKKAVKEDDGALIVEFEDLPPCLLKKSDGASTYALRDVAAGHYRVHTYHPDRILYVVDARQSLHFKQVFSTIKRIDDTDVFEHVPFGILTFKGKALATRKGEIVLLDDVLSKATTMAKTTIEEKNPDLKNKEHVAQAVGVGAVIFNDLSHDRVNDISFDWEQVLDFKGDTGPYVQYSYVRCCALLEKYGKEPEHTCTYTLESEKKLLRALTKFIPSIEKGVKENKPSHLATYLLDLARAFNNFYGEAQIIGSEKEEGRLLLALATKNTLAKGLDLLGMEHPEEM